MGMAPVAHVLFNKFMTFNPKNPEWVNRDRFVLSYAPFFFLCVNPLLVLSPGLVMLTGHTATVTDACSSML